MARGLRDRIKKLLRGHLVFSDLQEGDTFVYLSGYTKHKKIKPIPWSRIRCVFAERCEYCGESAWNAQAPNGPALTHVCPNDPVVKVEQ